MGAVVGSVALAEAGAPVPAAPPVAADPGGKTVNFSDGRTVNFADDAASNDRADQVLDEVLASEQGGSEPDGTHTPDPASSTPAPATDDDKTPTDKPKKPDEPKADAKAEPPDDLKLRRGFARLAEDKQKL